MTCRPTRRLFCGIAACLLGLCLVGCESAAAREARLQREREQFQLIWIGGIVLSVVAGGIGGMIGGARRGWKQDPFDD